MASLQDQLLNAGVIDKKKAKQIQKDKRKQAKQTPKGSEQIDSSKHRAQQALAERSQHDRDINQQRQKEVDKKAIFAQIIQLIKLNKVDRKKGDIAYQFSDGKKIKKLYVTSILQNQLVRGQIVIVKLAESYELVPTAVAEKIKQRDDSVIVLWNSKDTTQLDDDPYADYQIPDDLMW
jgi:uncharacterized protein YaiL (DUF2058 family)